MIYDIPLLLIYNLEYVHLLRAHLHLQQIDSLVNLVSAAADVDTALQQTRHEAEGDTASLYLQ